ncbi:MAG: AsmA family protein [Candidatus Omnitrophota bacterium]
MKLRNILIGLAILTLLAMLASGFYLYVIYLPKRLYGIATTSLAQISGRKITLAKAYVQFPKGIVLKDIVIYEPDEKTEFLRISELNCRVLLLPALKDKKVIVPSINLIEPSLTLNRTKQGLWNFQNLSFLTNKTFQVKDISFLVYRVNFNNASLLFKDELVVPGFERRLKEIYGAAFLGLPSDIKFRCSFKIADSVTEIGLAGGYSLIKKLLYLNGLAKELMPLDYGIYFKDKLPFALNSAVINPNVRFATYSDGRSRLLLYGDFKDLSIVQKDVSIGAAGALKADILFDRKNKTKLMYTGNIELAAGSVKGIYYLGTLSEIKAKADFTQDEITLKSFASSLYQSPLEATGTLKNYLTAPSLDINATYKGIPLHVVLEASDILNAVFTASIATEFDLSRIKDLVSREIAELIKDTSFEGNCFLRLEITSTGPPAVSYTLNGSATLSDAAIRNPQLPDKISGISGVVRFAMNHAEFENVSLIFKERHYYISGRLDNFAVPSINLSLKSQDLNFNSQLAAKRNAMQIISCDGNYSGIGFLLSGNILDFKDPYLNIEGSATFALSDAMELLPKYKEKLKYVELAEKIRCSFALTGKAKTPDAWYAAIEGTTRALRIRGFLLENPYVNMEIKGKKIYIPRITAGFYSGTINGRAEVDISQENPAFNLDATLLDANIAILKEAAQLKNKNLYGSLNVKLALVGVFDNASTYSGEGWVRIRNGYLWESPILSELAGIVYLPLQAQVVFKDAAATFRVRDQRIHSDDATLISDEMRLVAKGSVGFDTTLDCDIGLNLAGGLAESLNLTRLGTFLVTETGELLMDLQLKGTLAKPRFVKKLKPEKLLKEKILKQIPKLFEGMFE